IQLTDNEESEQQLLNALGLAGFVAGNSVGDIPDGAGGSVGAPGGSNGAFTPKQIAQIARNAGFTGQSIVYAVAVCLAESGGRPNAINDKNTNGSIDRGLWQINSIHGKLS